METLRSLKNGKASDVIAALLLGLCFRSPLDRTGWLLLCLNVEEGKPKGAVQAEVPFQISQNTRFQSGIQQ